jgi:hypothetical protein
MGELIVHMGASVELQIILKKRVRSLSSQSARRILPKGGVAARGGFTDGAGWRPPD